MKNKLGVYYGFLADSDEVNWVDCLHRAKAAHMDILEMSISKLQTLPMPERENIRALARELGLGITMATGFPPHGDLSSEDPAIRSNGVRFMKEQMETARFFGARVIGGMLVGTGKNFPAGVQDMRERAVENALGPLRVLAQMAGDQGIALCMEAINRFESAYLNTAEEAVQVAKAVDSPHLGVLLDSFHMNIEEVSMGDAIRRTGKHLKHFHACENNRMMPGRAQVDWDEIFGALKDVGYTGALITEALAKPYGTVAGRLNIWRRLSEDPDGEMAQAVVFLKGKGDAYGL
jgi:D-psicose/D-tagatose/L-ribulose 3-epimerase